MRICCDFTYKFGIYAFWTSKIGLFSLFSKKKKDSKIAALEIVRAL
jgi:hypothetical protein